MKKLIFSIAFVLVTSLIITACKGDAGPAGATGPAGPTGPAGSTGVAGNANVRLYNYGSVTFTGSVNYVITGISQGFVDSSLVLVYHNPSTEAATAWYPVPGIGSSNSYETRYFFFQTATSPSVYTMAIRAQTVGTTTLLTTPLTWTKLRIILAPASSILVGGRFEPKVDLKDYYAVCKFLNIPE